MNPESPEFIHGEYVNNFLDLDGFLSLSDSGSLDFELVPILFPAIIIKEANIYGSIFANGSLPIPQGTEFIIAPTFLLTKNESRGEIRIHSNNPLDQPFIIPPYFNDPQDNDLKRLTAALKKTRDLYGTKCSTWLQNSPSNKNGEDIQITGEVAPGPFVTTDEQIENYLLGFSIPSTHQVGGCSMGLSADQGAVVDQHFKVFGIQRLRIVDGSALPSLTQTRPQATIYAMAERAADFIKAEVS